MPSANSFNLWQYKPWWCQPWSIILTGISIIGGSWLLGQRIWLTILVTLPIILWWIYFLVVVPRWLSQQMARKNEPSIETNATIFEEQTGSSVFREGLGDG